LVAVICLCLPAALLIEASGRDSESLGKQAHPFGFAKRGPFAMLDPSLRVRTGAGGRRQADMSDGLKTLLGD
jgi:hypothetical protein